MLVVIGVGIRLLFGAIQDHAEEPFPRHLVQKLIDRRVTCLAGTYYEKPTVSARHQHVRVGENSQWRCVDDDVVKHTSHFREHTAVARSGEQFGDVVTRPSTRQKMKARWFE